MKNLQNLIYFLLLLFSINSYGQLSKFKGTWITQSHEAIIIDDTASGQNGTLSNLLEDDLTCATSVSGNKLTFIYSYYESSGKKDDNYDFEIISQSDYILLLKPSSHFSRKFFRNQRIMKFVRQELIADTSIHFERIIYHTTMCLGTCPTYHLEIDNNKKVRFYAEQVFISDFVEDTTKQGYFNGLLDQNRYDALISAIQTCNLKTLSVPDLMAFDAPVTTIIIYYNGQRKFVYTSLPPAILNRLIDKLYSICEKNNLPKTKEIFKLEEIAPSFVVHPK